jgi:hypothetical protein
LDELIAADKAALSFDNVEPPDRQTTLNKAAWAFGPPITTPTFGYVIGWIIGGFRPKKDRLRT